MTNVLNNSEMAELTMLGVRIKTDLNCASPAHMDDGSASGVPCYACRMDVIEAMQRYLEIHSFNVRSLIGREFPG